MKRRKMSFTTRYVLAVGLLLLVANMLLGAIILRQSQAAMRSLIQKNMLDIANSAAGMLDGDVLGALTEADVGGEAFNDIAEKLTVFQKNVDIHFIYTVKQSGADRYTFIVDPDPVEPAEFGEEIILTRALIEAGKGIATVDDEPAADRWGNFYTVYSPVFDSAGSVAGIVGIDFDAEWYDYQVWRHTVVIAVFSILSVLVGGVVVFLITHRVRKRFRELDVELSKLSSSVDELMAEVGAISGQSVSSELDPNEDEIEKLSGKIEVMQKDMVVYLEHLHRQAYTDGLTKVNNSTAYHEKTRLLDAQIANGDAAFSIALLDVNSLKEINDNLGHEYGDIVISGAAEAISSVFGSDVVYRIGGDEFVVIKDSIDDAQMLDIDMAIRDFNAAQTGVTLALSKGVAHYRCGEDMSVKQVFARADQMMYADKKAYYETIGNRRARK